jgi:hypothetical protein
MLNIQLSQGDHQGDLVPQLNSPHRSPGGQPSIKLGMGNSLYSPGGGFRVTLQATDGNLVLQVLNDAVLPPWQQGQKLAPPALQWIPIWSAQTNGKSVTEADMQVDGNLVVYAGGTPVFNTGTNGQEHSFLRMQDDGNLVIYSASGAAVFATGTAAGEAPGNNT